MQPAAPAARAAPASAPAPAPAAPPSAALLRREEIIDDKHRLCGYRFSLPAAAGRHAPPETEFIEALGAARITEFALRRLAVVPLTLDAVVFARHLPLVAPHTVFMIERQQVPLPPEQLVGRLLALKEAGCKVGLRGAGSDAAELAILAVCDIVFLDLGAQALPQFQALLRQLRSQFPKLSIAVEGVHAWDEHRMCLAWGCHYCLGDFLATKDQEDPDAKIDQSRLASIELLNLLRGDAELEELAKVAKRDPGLTFHVLKWANSPATGHATAITSVSQAIMVLGRGHLYRWLTVSMFRIGSQHARDESLLEVALTRARFLETVSAGTLGQAQRDEIFLVGLLSLFDVLLGVPMQKILAQMHLSEAVLEVLLRSGGRYGHYLQLALLIERGIGPRAAEIATTLGIDPATLGATSSAAFQWAQESLHHTLQE